MAKIIIKNPVKKRQPFTKTQWLCLFLYLISLCLPAIGFYYNIDKSIVYYHGIFVLIMGFLFGWIGLFVFNFGVLAVYANFFFYHLIISLNYNELPIKSSVTMLFLASLSFFYRDFGNGGIHNALNLDDYIYYWGYGAFFWFMAIIILATDCFYRKYKQKILPLKISFSMLFLSFIIIAGFQLIQYHKSADFEKKYFAKEIILTTYPIIGDKINKPTSSMIPITSNSVIEILNKEDERDISKFIMIEYEKYYFPEQFQYADNFWQLYRTDFDKNSNAIKRGYIAKLFPARSVDFYYESNQYNHQFLIYNKDKKIIWQSNDIFKELRDRNIVSYDYRDDLELLFSPLKTPTNIPSNDILSKQKFIKGGYDCVFKEYYGVNDLIGVFYINDTFYFRFGVTTEDYDVWCTPDYAIIATKVHRSNYAENQMFLFDRKRKEPVYEFESNRFNRPKIDIEYNDLMIDDIKIEESEGIPYIVANTRLGDVYFDVKR